MQTNNYKLAILGISILSFCIGYFSTISTIVMVHCVDKQYRCRVGLTCYGLGVFLGGAYSPKLLWEIMEQYGTSSPPLVLSIVSLITILIINLNQTHNKIEDNKKKALI